MSNSINRSDELFDNIMPHRQLLTKPIADCLTRVTRFDFSPRVVQEDEGRRFGVVLRLKLICIQDEAMSMFAGSKTGAERVALEWLAGDGSAQRILHLVAFVRAGSFRIERSCQFLILTVEVSNDF